MQLLSLSKYNIFKVTNKKLPILPTNTFVSTYILACNKLSNNYINTWSSDCCLVWGRSHIFPFSFLILTHCNHLISIETISKSNTNTLERENKVTKASSTFSVFFCFHFYRFLPPFHFTIFMVVANTLLLTIMQRAAASSPSFHFIVMALTW